MCEIPINTDFTMWKIRNEYYKTRKKHLLLTTL